MKLFIGLQFYGDEKSSGKSKKQQQQKKRFPVFSFWLFGKIRLSFAFYFKQIIIGKRRFILKELTKQYCIREWCCNLFFLDISLSKFSNVLVAIRRICETKIILFQHYVALIYSVTFLFLVKFYHRFHLIRHGFYKNLILKRPSSPFENLVKLFSKPPLLIDNSHPRISSNS